MFTSEDIPSLQGKIALVTGSNSGIGLETVKALASHGATVYMASRTESKAQDAIAKLEQADPSCKGRIKYVHLDLLDLRGVIAAAKRLTQELPALHILVNNAGVMANPYEITKDGVEIQLQSNHVGPFCFTQTLMPLLQKTAKQEPSSVRIVNVSSYAHTIPSSVPLSHPAFKDLRSANKHFNMPFSSAWQRYGQSKLCNLLYTKELTARYPEITTLSTHPGMIKTDLWQHAGLFARFTTLVSPAQGAIASLYAATSPDVLSKNLRGAYICPGPVVGTATKLSQDPKLAADLWKLSESILHDKSTASQ